MRDADAGIRNPEKQLDLGLIFIIQLDGCEYSSVLREFDRIGTNIGQYLFESAGITSEVLGDIIVYQTGEFQIFIRSFNGQNFDHIINRFLKVEIQELQLHFAGLDFGKVQDIIDDRKQ